MLILRTALQSITLPFPVFGEGCRRRSIDNSAASTAILSRGSHRTTAMKSPNHRHFFCQEHTLQSKHLHFSMKAAVHYTVDEDIAYSTLYPNKSNTLYRYNIKINVPVAIDKGIANYLLLYFQSIIEVD